MVRKDANCDSFENPSISIHEDDPAATCGLESVGADKRGNINSGGNDAIAYCDTLNATPVNSHIHTFDKCWGGRRSDVNDVNAVAGTVIYKHAFSCGIKIDNFGGLLATDAGIGTQWNNL